LLCLGQGTYALKLYFYHLPKFGDGTTATKQSRTAYAHTHSKNNEKKQVKNT